jgi:8-oxo-dGTP diphosphatase
MTSSIDQAPAVVGTNGPLEAAAPPQAASLVVLKRDCVLMVQRARPPFEGLWSFPGGRALPGEDAAATARRELLEETGLSVGPVLQLGRFQPAPEISPIMLTVFAARAGPGRPQAGDDAIRAEFVPLSRVLARPLTAGAPGWIARALVALAEPPLLS